MFAAYCQIKTSKRKLENDYWHYYNNLLRTKPDDTYPDISTKCRVCLQDGNSSIYEEESMEETIEALQIFANIFVNEDDGCPKLLCSNCKRFIKQAIAFRKVAMRSEKLLKKPVKEEIHNTFDNDNDYSNNSDDTKEPEKWSNIEVPIVDCVAVKPEKEEKELCSSKMTCPICKKVVSRSYFKIHVTIHDPDHKRYICDICGKSFRLQCAHHNHLRLCHSTGFPYKCQVCPYRAQYKELLKMHMRTHSGDYRYKCTECPAKFLVKSNLSRHMFKHKEPTFQCESCKRAFHTKQMLEQHNQCDHLGIKNHVCNICGKAFGYRKAMMKHERGVHKREKISLGRLPTYLKAENKN